MNSEQKQTSSQKIIPGLVSITFRQWSPEEIIRHMQETGLKAVEWGGDVHVPHGDVKTAALVGRQTREAGLEVKAYGSYYRAGAEAGRGPLFDEVLSSAVELGAPLIRVWPGQKGSEEHTPSERQEVIEDLRRIADLAAVESVGIVLEYHGGTLTDTCKSAVDVMEDLQHPNVKTIWQPRGGLPQEQDLTGLRLMLPWLSYLHVFHWVGESLERRPLREGEEDWDVFFHTAVTASPDLYAMLEFVQGDSLESLQADAAALVDWSRRFID